MNKDLKSLIIMLKAYQGVTNHIKLSLQDSKLSLNEFAALEALYVKKSLTTQELIDTVLIPNSSMSHVIKTLANKDYLYRKKDQADRRIQYLALTEKGKKLFSKVYDKHYKHMRKLFDILTPEEEKNMQNALRKLGKHAMSVL
ncbi:MAG: MarR family transcriptional regulator [Clostridiaceae bacterium]|jgi:MarR family 2-MHQ and catechol resistance regulon transcriptional repressor|nr:MarR family transcriptional regulator [Bacillota bacterium]NLN52438.1 MarR family transcriptional regulator [Clostridiaceae bacterium]